MPRVWAVRLLWAGCCAVVPWAGIAAPGGPSTAVFYGSPIPVGELSHFERVVLEPDNATDLELDALRAGGAELFAYLSVGEVHASRPERALLKKAWILGENATWGGVVVDPTAPGWRALLLERAEAYWARGFRGFFLDTLDAYRGVPADARVLEEREAATAELVLALHARLPQARLVFNRGFELLDRIGPVGSGLAAESLFDGLGPGSRRYRPVPSADREWLLARLREARDRHGLAILVIDYLPAGERVRARRTAERIAALGFTPYVTNDALDEVGVGAVEPVPRRILVVHGAGEAPGPALAPLLRPLGFTLDLHDLARGVPPEPRHSRYAGVIAWFPSGAPAPRPAEWSGFASRLLDSGHRIAFLGGLGTLRPEPLASKLGIGWREGALEGPARAAGPGLRPRPAPLRPFAKLSAPAGARVFLEVSAAGGTTDAAFTAGWGGLALAAVATPAGARAAGLNLSDLLVQALRLPAIPAPDLAFENGRRVLLVELRAEGSNEPGGSGTAAGELVRERLVRAFRLPTGLPPTSDSDAARLFSREPSVAAVPAPWSGPLPGHPAAAALPLSGGRLALAEPVDDGEALPRAASGSFPLVLRHACGDARTAKGLARLVALYRRAVSAETLPLSLDEHLARLEGFERLTLSRGLDGRWKIRQAGALRTLRLDPVLGWPDAERSKGIAGHRDLPGGRYVALDGRGWSDLALRPDRPRLPGLAWSDAPLVSFESEGGRSTWRWSRRPNHLAFTRFACEPSPGAALQPRGDLVLVRVAEGGPAEFSLQCLRRGVSPKGER